jgi:hypothetical protein
MLCISFSTQNKNTETGKTKWQNKQTQKPTKRQNEQTDQDAAREMQGWGGVIVRK